MYMTQVGRGSVGRRRVGWPGEEQWRWSAGIDRNYWLTRGRMCASWQVRGEETPGFLAKSMWCYSLSQEPPPPPPKWRCWVCRAYEMSKWGCQGSQRKYQPGGQKMCDGSRAEWAWARVRGNPRVRDRQSESSCRADWGGPARVVGGESGPRAVRVILEVVESWKD